MRSCATCGQRFSGEATFCPFDGTKLEGGGTDMALAKPPEELAPGAVIGGNYRIDRTLGEGGMGIVFAVTHLKLGKKFALKLLKKALARDPETRARFLVEAQAAGQIHHPNVVEITDYTSLPDGSAYMVMEYLEGQPLSRMIKLGGALPALRAVTIVRDVAAGLQAAHEAGVVHRDLKPDNVFVMQKKDGTELAKILDFGVAKVAGSAKLTRTGMVFGTPHYMSPEQASGGAIDARTDVYALGVIMYEMFTGHVPFEADTYMGVLTKHMFEAPVPPSQLPGPARELGALEDVTLRALAKRPEERYASMSDLVHDLDRIVQIAADGRVSVAPNVDGIKRPDFVGNAEEKRRALAKLNLADELEPPAREEIAVAHLNHRERRVRRIGIFAIGAILLLGVGITVTALAGRSQSSRGPGGGSDGSDGRDEGKSAAASSPRPIETASAAQTSTVSPTATTATTATDAPVNSVEPPASSIGDPIPSSTATQAPTTHPTVAPPSPKPPKKRPSSTDLEDPWAK